MQVYNLGIQKSMNVQFVTSVILSHVCFTLKSFLFIREIFYFADEKCRGLKRVNMEFGDYLQCNSK